MATNKYFRNFNTKNEQLLLEDLVIETIKIHGIDMYYIPRELFLEQPSILFGDDPISRFRQHFIVEMYIKTVEGFEGEGDIIGKFGLEVKDTATLVVSVKRFRHITNKDRPMEGDLLYFPLTESFFEIKFVEDENPFFQLGKNYTFDLSVELFQYSHEDIMTQIPEIDSIVDTVKYLKFIGLEENGTTYQKGQVVYTFANGSTFGDLNNASGRGVVVQYDDSENILTLEKIVGSWKSSANGKNYYLIAEDDSYRKIVSVGNSVDNNQANDNKPIGLDSDTLLDFSEFNPFKDMF
jgi:hypothetical protein